LVKNSIAELTLTPLLQPLMLKIWPMVCGGLVHRASNRETVVYICCCQQGI